MMTISPFMKSRQIAEENIRGQSNVLYYVSERKVISNQTYQ